MGIYHLMGLGRSVGVVTGPISYLAELYDDKNWEAKGKEFFASSGEEEQRKKGERVGGIQLIVLFTTKEVIDGDVDCEPFIKNPYGKIGGNPEKKIGEIREVLKPLLIEEWSKIKGQGNTGIIYWCEVELRDIQTTYERIAKVVASLAKGSGQQGKEIWMNLTGGNNVINSALQMTASLSGEVARIYYVQAANDKAEKCVHFTDINNYWVELPVIPLTLSELNNEILNIIDQEKEIYSSEILSKLQAHEQYWRRFPNMELEDFINKYLRPLKKQRLINVRKYNLSDKDGICTIGSQWQLILAYGNIMKEALHEADRESLTIEKLEEQETWISRQEIKLN